MSAKAPETAKPKKHTGIHASFIVVEDSEATSFLVLRLENQTEKSLKVPLMAVDRDRHLEVLTGEGALADADATGDRQAMAGNRSTRPAVSRMTGSNHNPNRVTVPPARIPEEPVAVIPQAGIREKGAWHAERPN